MNIEENSDQELSTHPELGLGPAESDLAKQRAIWLRCLIHLGASHVPLRAKEEFRLVGAHQFGRFKSFKRHRGI